MAVCAAVFLLCTIIPAGIQAAPSESSGSAVSGAVERAPRSCRGGVCGDAKGASDELNFLFASLRRVLTSAEDFTRMQQEA